MYNNTKHTGAHNAQDALNEGTVELSSAATAVRTSNALNQQALPAHLSSTCAQRAHLARPSSARSSSAPVQGTCSLVVAPTPSIPIHPFPPAFAKYNIKKMF